MAGCGLGHAPWGRKSRFMGASHAMRTAFEQKIVRFKRKRQIATQLFFYPGGSLHQRCDAERSRLRSLQPAQSKACPKRSRRGRGSRRTYGCTPKFFNELRAQDTSPESRSRPEPDHGTRVEPDRARGPVVNCAVQSPHEPHRRRLRGFSSTFTPQPASNSLGPVS